jgi:hypothetical protein
MRTFAAFGQTKRIKFVLFCHAASPVTARLSLPWPLPWRGGLDFFRE